MKYPHIATGKHIVGSDPRFRINTAPGLMHSKGVNEAHGSYLTREVARELRDELDAWLRANPTIEEQVFAIVGDRLPTADALRLVRLLDPGAPTQPDGGTR